MLFFYIFVINFSLFSSCTNSNTADIVTSTKNETNLEHDRTQTLSAPNKTEPDEFNSDNELNPKEKVNYNKELVAGDTFELWMLKIPDYLVTKGYNLNQDPWVFYQHHAIEVINGVIYDKTSPQIRQEIDDYHELWRKIEPSNGAFKNSIIISRGTYYEYFPDDLDGVILGAEYQRQKIKFGVPIKALRKGITIGVTEPLLTDQVKSYGFDPDGRNGRGIEIHSVNGEKWDGIVHFKNGIAARVSDSSFVDRIANNINNKGWYLVNYIPLHQNVGKWIFLDPDTKILYAFCCGSEEGKNIFKPGIYNSLAEFIKNNFEHYY